MADPNETFSTLDDFLLSLADGVTQAQAELARAGALGPAGRQLTYQLPRVDFELKLNLRVVEDAALSNRYQSVRVARSSDKHLLFRPVPAEAASATTEVAATVRGAFVAVPANAGLPPVSVESTLVLDDRRAPLLRVRARNAAGEPVASLAVECNIDREESAAISEASGMTLELQPDTAFERSLITTGPEGTASVRLKIGDEQAPALLALVIDAAGNTETLVYQVQP